MSAFYSFSRIDSFEKCKLQFKYRYIDKLATEIETIEAFMGKRVHEALKEFYDFIKNRIIKPKDWLISRYEELWRKNFQSSIKIVKKEFSAEDYYEKGKKCLIDYYEEYNPFDQTKIIKTEEHIYFSLRRNEEEFPFSGILDRLDWNDREKKFEIHDYKTSATLISQDEADKDFQLGLYQLALLEKWPDAEDAKLIWHFLLFNKQMESYRTKEELRHLQDRVIEKIKAVEACHEFPPKKSALCDWCDYQDICPLWKHPKKLLALDLNEYMKDPGVKLVSRYSELEEEKKELKEKIADIEHDQAKIAEAAVKLAEKEDIRVIDGPDRQLVVSIREEFSTPSRREDVRKWEELRNFLIDENRYVEVSTVNYSMLNRMLKQWPQEFLDKTKMFLTRKIVKKVDLRKKT